MSSGELGSGSNDGAHSVKSCVLVIAMRNHEVEADDLRALKED